MKDYLVLLIFAAINSARIMVSRLRMKLDLLVQGISLTTMVFAILLAPWPTAVIVVLLILAGIQITSAAQLWLWHHYRKARTFLWFFFGTAVLLPIGFYFFSHMAWLSLIALAIVYFLHTIYMTQIVLRRPRSFWDIQ